MKPSNRQAPESTSSIDSARRTAASLSQFRLISAAVWAVLAAGVLAGGAAAADRFDSELLKRSPDELEKAYAGKTPPECVRMLLAIHKGSMMGAGEGWFGPAQSRFSWDWLSKRFRASESGISKDQFTGPGTLFAVLDRNRDGQITADDLDWSDRNPWVQQAYQMNRYFRRVDRDGDGQLTREDWIAFFDRARGDKETLSSEAFRDAFLGGGGPKGFLPGDAPTREMLLRGLAAGEIGSPHEGPALGDLAPDFTLKTHDGKATVHLADVIGPKPVVLVFGNYTCGPFRSMYPGVEDVYKRFHDDATFLAVYVREAHPTDGWKMKSNEMVGVAVAQPRTYEERAAVAATCGKLLKTSMPLLVDEIDDPTGHAYSGMPARLYVIDRAGKVAYKGGRGPFGFKTGEMEQALAMTLLDQAGTREKAR